MSQASSKAAQVPSAVAHGAAREDWTATGTMGHKLSDRIGNTPLLRLEHLVRGIPGAGLFGKAEWYNPGGSVKDRAAANIVREACLSGKFGPKKILLDSTSGNTGIAYAMLG